ISRRRLSVCPSARKSPCRWKSSSSSSIMCAASRRIAAAAKPGASARGLLFFQGLLFALECNDLVGAPLRVDNIRHAAHDTSCDAVLQAKGIEACATDDQPHALRFECAQFVEHGRAFTHQSHPIRVEADGVGQDVVFGKQPEVRLRQPVLEVGVGGAPDPVASDKKYGGVVWLLHGGSIPYRYTKMP